MSYRIDVPGLDEALARTTPTPKHERPVACLRKFDALRNAKLSTQRGDAYLERRKVLDAQGRIVSDSHETWLREQLEADAGHADTTYKRLKDAGYLLSRCDITTLYLVHDRGSADESNFVQAEIDLEDEWSDCELFTGWPYRAPRDLQDLLNMHGSELPADQRQPVRAPTYKLRRVVDIQEFVREAIALEIEWRDRLRQRQYTIETHGSVEQIQFVTDPDARVDKLGKPVRTVSADEAFPGWDSDPVKWGRIFADWAVSSAGRSGARLCDNWGIQIAD